MVRAVGGGEGRRPLFSGLLSQLGARHVTLANARGPARRLRAAAVHWPLKMSEGRQTNDPRVSRP